jgi:outer membrane protein with beta-barrel domain
MKKIVALSMIVFFAFSMVNAQSTRFALTASPLIAFPKINSDDIKGNGVYFGINYGVLGEFIIDKNEQYAFRTGFTLTSSGASVTTAFNDTAGSIIVNQKLKYQFIDIPLTLVLKTNEVGYIKYYGVFGVTQGFAISAKLNEEVASDPTGNYKPVQNGKLEGSQIFNTSLTLGAGIEYSFGSGTSLIAGLEYNNGFTNIYKTTINENKATMALRSLLLRIGFLF